MSQQDRLATQPNEDEEILVRLRNLSKRYGRTQAVQALDLDIRKGEFFALLGPSGCGKTTLLNLIGGFAAPSTGVIEIDGRDVTALGPERRRTNMVFQGYGLFPHMTVRQNITYGLQIAKTPPDETKQRVARVTSLVHLTDLEHRLPAELSGGQQQRVALARALVMEPAVLLLDEPLAALDLKLRKAVQEELRHLHRAIGGTFMFVTHDQTEAMALANRIAVMQDGRIVQQGTPEEIYANPASEFVAGFIGEANILHGRRISGRIELDGGIVMADKGPDRRVIVVVRPDDVFVTDETTPEALEVALPGMVKDRIYLGTHDSLKVTLDCGHDVVAYIRAAHGADAPGIGDRIHIGWHTSGRRIVEKD